MGLSATDRVEKSDSIDKWNKMLMVCSTVAQLIHIHHSFLDENTRYKYTYCNMMIISVFRCLLTSHVIMLPNSCSIADCGYLIRPSCLTHYLSWFYFVCLLCWLTDQRGFLASSGPSYCMTSSWVFLLQQTGQQLPRPYCSPLCVWITDKEKGLSKVRGEKTPSGSD